MADEPAGDIDDKVRAVYERAINAALVAAPDDVAAIGLGFRAAQDLLNQRIATPPKFDRNEIAIPGIESEDITREMLRLTRIVLDVGGELAQLADPDVAVGDLLDMMRGLRREIASEYGVIIPGVSVRPRTDALAPREYQIRVFDDVVEGVARDEASVVEHVRTVVVRNLASFLNREEVAELANMLRGDEPMVVQELVPNMLSVGQLRQVLQHLVRERVSIRDLSAIFNALADNAVYTKDPHALAEHVRGQLGRAVYGRHQSPDGSISAFVLSPDAERAIQNSIQLNETGQVLMLDPSTSQAIRRSLEAGLERHPEVEEAVVISPPKIRRHVLALLERSFSRLSVLSYSELAPDVEVVTLGTIETASIPQVVTPSSGGEWLLGDEDD